MITLPVPPYEFRGKEQIGADGSDIGERRMMRHLEELFIDEDNACTYRKIPGGVTRHEFNYRTKCGLDRTGGRESI